MSRLQSLKPGERRAALGVLLVGLCLLVYTQVIEPRIEIATDLNNRIRLVEAELSGLSRLLEHREAIEAQSQLLQSQIGSAGMEDQQINALMETTEALALENQLTTISLRSLQPQNHGYYRILRLQFIAEGSERATGKFLYDLGDAAQLIRVDRLTVTALRNPGEVRSEIQISRILSMREQP